MNRVLVVLAFWLVAAVCPAFAQTEVNKPWEEYEKLLKGKETLASYGPDLFGDAVDLQNGGLSFTTTDASIPGNSSLPVAFTRTYQVKSRKGLVSDSPLADWGIDTPNLSGTYAPNWPTKRCTAATVAQAAPPTVSSGGAYFSSEDYWQGIQANMPGGGELLLADKSTKKPSAGGPYYWLTSGFTYFSCLPTIKNGTGEGFLAITTDGTKYWFDWMGQFLEPSLGDGKSSNRVGRRKNILYATRVEDRFGNWVTYKYSNTSSSPGRLTEIAANDGRKITVAYNAQGYVSTVSDGSHSWSYLYDHSVQNESTLTRVTLPDASRWTIGFAELTHARIRYEQPHCTPAGQGQICDPVRSCSTPGLLLTGGAQGTITHPSGATGKFEVDPTLHGRSNVPMVCGNYESPYNDPNNDISYYPLSYHSFSLTKKTLTGPGLSPMTWSYGYGATISFAPGTGPVCTSSSGCGQVRCTSDSCAGTASTTVASPGGEWTRHVFGNSYRYNEGKLLRMDRGASASSILRTETSTYDWATSGRLYPTPIGTSPQARGDGFTSEYLRPQLSRVIAQEGGTYTTQSWVFDLLARAKTEKKTSSLGYTRTDSVTLYDDYSLWVLGQVASSTNVDTGKVTGSQTFGFKSLPYQQYRFGQLAQTLGYHTDDGTVSSVADGKGNKTWLSAWKRGIPGNIKYPDAKTQLASINNDGTIASVTDENGFVTGYQYDVMGRLTRTSFPTGDTTTWAPITRAYAQLTTAEYGIPAGHWRQIDYNGNHRNYTYFDALWRPVLSLEQDQGNALPTRRMTARAFDHAGRETFASYPVANAATISEINRGIYTTYDVLGRARKTQQNSELGTLTTTTNYASDGGYQIRTDPRGNVTRTWYQSFDEPAYGAPVKVTRPEAITTTIARDVFGKPTTLTQGSVTRRYFYDSEQRLCRVMEPESNSTVMEYDNADNVIWTVSGLNYSSSTACYQTQALATGKQVTRTYDTRNRPLKLAFPDGLGNTTYTYTPDGLPASIVAENGGSNTVTTTYAYNERRLPTSERMVWGSVNWLVSYAYDGNANLAAQNWHGVNVDYAPNALGQPTRAGTYATGASYYPNGTLKQFTYGNGIVHNLTQNDRQFADRSRDTYGSTVIHDNSFDYDQNGNVAAITDGRTGQPDNRTMTYDGVDRLKGVTAPMFGGDGKAVFSYDALDNLLAARVGNKSNVSYVYDARNQLTNVRNSAGTTIMGLGYDTQGNLNNRNGKAYTFDYGNRLRSAALTSGAATYVYDGLGRRVRDLSGESKYSQYTQKGELVLTSDSRAGKVTDYISLAGSLIATRERDTATNTYQTRYHHTDALGSPVAVTSESRAVVERSQYAPFGALLNRPVTDGPGYTGHVEDAATGLTYMQQRYYDPGLGRFLSVDPVTADANSGGNFNRYWYGNNNPYKFTDPDGREVSCSQSSCTIESHSVLETVVDYGTVGVVYAGRMLSNAIAGAQRNESTENTPEPGTAESDEGCVYCVSGENTRSGKDYIGTADDLDNRAKDSSDGRDRRGAEKVDSYKKGDRTDRQNKEQKAMNDRGGKTQLDNKRNEVAPKKWEGRGIDPPTE